MDDKKESLWSKLIGVLALAFGAFIGKYNWAALLIVAIGAVVFYWLASKYKKRILQPFIFAIAVLGGHFAWFLFGYLYTFSSDVLFDLVIILIGVLWLGFKPSIGPVVLLIIYESFSVIVNLYQMFVGEFETALFAAFLLHAVLRISAIVFLFIGYKELKKIKQVDEKWYYAKGEKQEGPVSKVQIQQLIDEGILNAESLVWKETLSEWTPIDSIGEFNNKISIMPPPIPKKDNTPTM